MASKCNTPTTWATMATKSLGAGSMYTHTSRPRVVQTEAQIRANFEARDAAERKGMCNITDQEMRARFGHIMDFYVFADVYDWPTLEFVNIVGLDGLVDMGTFNELEWWHGYSPSEDIILQFKYRRGVTTIHVHRNPSWTYKNAVINALNEEEIDVPAELMKK